MSRPLREAVITMVPIARIVRTAFLALLATQFTVIAALVAIDSRRKQRRPPSGRFPRRAPGAVTIGGSRVTTYTYGEDLYAAMLTEIKNARERIMLETFIWKADPVGREFKRELTRAANRGVSVYVIYDAFANLVVPQSFKRFPPEVRVLEYPVFPQRWRIFSPRRSGRDHRKMLVVDDRVGFVGGFNVGSMYATSWRDTHVRIEGPSVWGLRNAFIDFWNLSRGDRHPALLDSGTDDWETRVRVHRNVPRVWMFPIRGVYLEAFDRARSHIYLTQPYFMPDDQFLESLLDAARRGVDVRILMPEVSNHVVADCISRGFYDRLLRGGVRLLLYQDAMLHAKTATVDGRWSTVGTANIDRVSLTGNYEVNVEFYDSDFAANMEQIFTTDCGNAHELSLADWQRRPVTARISETVLAPLRPLL